MNKYTLIVGAFSLGLAAMPSAYAQKGDYVTREEFNKLKEQLTQVEATTETHASLFSRDMQYYREPGKEGINVFEAPKTTDVTFDGVKVRVGGASTLQFQGITHDNDAGNLPSLTNNFNLATANLDLDVALADGVRMHLRTYLSSQHHSEAWVKGGYLQVDSLDFISDGFLAGLMDNVRIKVGHMELNYGDNHFRRTDNADSMYNPFVGNYIMDSFTTEVGAEVYYFCEDYFGMVGVSNGNLNQSTLEKDQANEPSFYGKIGFDKQIDEDLRVRLTGSVLASFNSAAQYLYDGDRAGSRYYNVVEGNFRAGRFAPGYDNELIAFMVNPFIKYKGLEVYGVLETVSGEKGEDSYSANQYAAEVLYRFGENERFYVGARYNLVDSEMPNGADDVEIERINVGGGWFITDHVLAKVEYVTQEYDGFTDKRDGAEFDGIVLEGSISF